MNLRKVFVCAGIAILACGVVVNAADEAKKKKPAKGGGKGAFFTKMDSDGNGSISKDEFVAASKARMKAQAEKAGKADQFEAQWEKRSKGLDKRFTALDGNADGSVTKEEFAKAGPPKGKKKPGEDGGKKKKKKDADS